jgi:sulfur-carrier protein
MPKIYLPTIMRKSADGQSTLYLDGTTVRQVLSNLVRLYPDVGGQLLDQSGNVQRHINLYVNDEDIRSLSGDSTTLADRDELFVLPAMAGGA